MPAVNPLLAIVAPASVPSKASRPGFVLQDMLSARTPENTGVRPSDNQQDGAARAFASELEKGLEQQSEKRESSRSAREEANRRERVDRKENAAAQADSGNALPEDGRKLPAEPAQDEHRAALEIPAESIRDESVRDESEPLILAAGVDTPPGTQTQSEPTTVLADPLEDAAAAAVTASLVLDTPAPATAFGITAPLTAADPQGQSGLLQSATPPTLAAADAPQAPVSTQTSPILASALPGATEAEAMQLPQPQASTQLEADVRQAQSSAAALAQAQGSAPGALLDLLPGQGDLAERVRAWRGLSAVEGMLPPSLSTRSDAAGPSLFAQSSGQLQQFVDSLRIAVGQAEAPSLIPGAERNTSTSAATPAAAPGALSGAAAAAPADAGGAWRVDNLQLPALNGGARPAPGTLQFLQTMPPSNFGAPLGETFGQNAWAESVTQRVALMTGLKLSSARIELDPPELGAMTVKVSVSGDQASVSFASPHAIVRDALEQTFPRLQEMLGQQGLQLADAQVSDQSAERRQSGDAAAGNRSAAAASGDEGSESVAVQNVNVATSLIDYYA